MSSYKIRQFAVSLSFPKNNRYFTVAALTRYTFLLFLTYHPSKFIQIPVRLFRPLIYFSIWRQLLHNSTISGHSRSGTFSRSRPHLLPRKVTALPSIWYNVLTKYKSFIQAHLNKYVSRSNFGRISAMVEKLFAIFLIKWWVAKISSLHTFNILRGGWGLQGNFVCHCVTCLYFMVYFVISNDCGNVKLLFIYYVVPIKS